MIDNELLIIGSITFVGIFIYSMKDGLKNDPPKNVLQFFWHLMVTIVVSAVFTIPMMGAIYGLIFGWIGYANY